MQHAIDNEDDPLSLCSRAEPRVSTRSLDVLLADGLARSDPRFAFLSGGGETGALARSIDWSGTSLGSPETWPACLKTTVGILLNSRQPMLLWWGPDFIQFYNDAYLPSLGAGKHPHAMGQRGAECWPESWAVIEPRIRNVVEHAEPSWDEASSYSAVFDEQHHVAGILVLLAGGPARFDVSLAGGPARFDVAGAEELGRRADFEQYVLGIVRHDLRNPLNVLQVGAAVLAANNNLDPLTTKVVSSMQLASRRCEHMISDLLDFTQARLGGGLVVKPGETNLHQIAKEVLEELRTTHPERSLMLTHDGDGGGTWDATRMMQLLSNLVGHAIRHGSLTSPVRVTISGNAEYATLKVHSRGEPIPAELLPTVFSPTPVRGSSSGSPKPSVELGLFIVSEIAKGHNGSIELTSTREEGTCFTVVLPRRCGGVMKLAQK